MATVNYPEGKLLYKSGDKITELGLIVKGQVRCCSRNNQFILGPGNLMGIIGCATGLTQCDYVTTEPTTICGFPYGATEDLQEIFRKQPDYGSVFLLAAIKETSMVLAEYKKLLSLVKEFYAKASSLYRKYGFLCTQYGMEPRRVERFEDMKPFDYRETLEPWRLDYFETLGTMELDQLKELFTVPALNAGNIFLCSVAMAQSQRAIDNMKDYLQANQGSLLNDQKNDLFSLFEELAWKTEEHSGAAGELVDSLIDFLDHSGLYGRQQLRSRINEYDQGQVINDAISEEEIVQETGFDPDMGENLNNSLEEILDYGDFTQEEKENFTEHLYAIRDLQDPYSTEEEARRLRQEVSREFYRCYKNVVHKTLEEGIPSTVITMFLYFGYMDAGFAGEENTEELRKLSQELYLCQNHQVVPFYHWLEMIYHGECKPSLSEFDQDYDSALRSAVRTGELTQNQADELKENAWEKVCYELDNMFRITSKISCQRVTTFLPVLSEHEIITSPDRMLVKASKLQEALDQIRSIDYGLFYREVLFSDEAHGIRSEYIQQEILPYLILLPVAGSRGMMWQVTEGAKSATPARMTIPILSIADTADLILENAGRYRWEMCRKLQGVRWNDVTDPSLTSEFSDYIQYYRKNYDLSPEGKEKIKNALLKAKNNYREVFVRDYEMWIKYESKGSFRLNKVAREILFRYCPFSKEYRNLLQDNPAYRDLFQKYDILTARQKKKIENWYDRYQKAGGEITEELQHNLSFYDL